VFGSELEEVTPIFTKTTVLLRPIQRLVKLKSTPLSHATRQLKNEVKNSFYRAQVEREMEGRTNPV
jgi:hypothetical protein